MTVEGLVFFGRLEVMIAVASQLIERNAPNIEVGIPRVMRLNPFIPAGLRFVSLQAVVFDVIDAFQKQEGNDSNEGSKQHDVP